MPTWLFIDGLSNSFTNDQLLELVSPFGDVLVAQVMYTRMGLPLGYGYVQMSDDQAAREAVAAMDLHRLGSETLHVVLIPRRPEETVD
jgi:RNA recognition motif-containing protein